MVIHYFDVFRSIVPGEAYTVFVIDPDAVLACPVAVEHLEVIARRFPQRFRFHGGGQHHQFTQSHLLNRAKTPHGALVENAFRILVLEAFDHFHPLILSLT